MAWRWCAIAGKVPVPLKEAMMRCAVRAGGHVASSCADRRRSPAINPSGVRMPANPGCWSGLRWQASDLDGLEMPSLRGGIEGLARPRYTRVRATAAGTSAVVALGLRIGDSAVGAGVMVLVLGPLDLGCGRGYVTADRC